jgi:hypothetical protein
MRAHHGADPAPVARERSNQGPAHHAATATTARSKAEPKVAASSRPLWPAASGVARTTTIVPAGNRSRRGAIRCWRRRRSRLRRTAGPTALPTMKPARAGLALASLATWITSPGAPIRRPSRTVAVKSSRRRTRRFAGSTAGPTPTALRVPCGDARRESRGRHGCACAAGSHASSRADGCSAGTCACSQLLPPAVQGSFTCLWHAQATLVGRACQGTGAREARSNGRTVKSQSLPPGQDDTPMRRQPMWASGCSGGASAVSVPAPAFPDRPFRGWCPCGDVGWVRP